MLPLEVRKYLYNIRQACELLHEFTTGEPLADYASHAMLVRTPRGGKVYGTAHCPG